MEHAASLSNPSSAATAATTFRALSGKTRLEVLSVLSDGERNLADLSRLVKKNKSTVLEHVQLLVAAGFLARKEEPGRKWVFYFLTEKGKEVVDGRTKGAAFLWGALASLAAGGYFLFRSLFPAGVESALSQGAAPAAEAAKSAGALPLAASVLDIAAQPPAGAAVASASFRPEYLAILFIAVGLLLIAVNFFMKKRIEEEVERI